MEFNTKSIWSYALRNHDFVIEEVTELIQNYAITSNLCVTGNLYRRNPKNESYCLEYILVIFQSGKFCDIQLCQETWEIIYKKWKDTAYHNLEFI
jgi:hypothetical protein